MGQYNEILAWKCIKCGRVLTTQKGIANHMKRCKYVPAIPDGQLGFDDIDSHDVALEQAGCEETGQNG